MNNSLSHSASFSGMPSAIQKLDGFTSSQADSNLCSTSSAGLGSKEIRGQLRTGCFFSASSTSESGTGGHRLHFGQLGRPVWCVPDGHNPPSILADVEKRMSVSAVVG